MALTDESSGNFVATMPMQPIYGGIGGGYGGGFLGGNGNDWMGILFLIALLNGGFGGWGMGMGGMMWPMMMGAGMGGFGGIDYLYPWLNNSEHISDGFRDQQLSNQISGLRSDVTGGFSDVQLGIAGLGRQICETGNGISGAVRDGFYGAEVTAQGRHNALTGQLYQGEINALNRSFAEQTANAQGFSNVNSGIADLRYTEATEACATRTASTQNTNTIITAIKDGVQSIKDELCADRIEGYKRQVSDRDREIDNLNSRLFYANEQAARVAQSSQIVDSVYNRLSQCPVGTTPVYGNTPIFSCGNSCGCGCGVA